MVAFTANGKLQKSQQQLQDDEGHPQRPSLLERSQVYFPVMPLWLAIIFGIANVVAPGWGTAVSSLFTCACCCKVFHYNPELNIKRPRLKSFFACLFFGFLQMITGRFGLAWSVIWGFLYIVQAANHLPEFEPVRRCSRRYVPRLSLRGAITMLVINTVLPGVGTLISGCLKSRASFTSAPFMFANPLLVSLPMNAQGAAAPADSEPLVAPSRCKRFWVTLVIALLQFVLAFVAVGWVWSIYWGTLFIYNAVDCTSSCGADHGTAAGHCVAANAAADDNQSARADATSASATSTDDKQALVVSQ